MFTVLIFDLSWLFVFDSSLSQVTLIDRILARILTNPKVLNNLNLSSRVIIFLIDLSSLRDSLNNHFGYLNESTISLMMFLISLKSSEDSIKFEVIKSLTFALVGELKYFDSFSFISACFFCISSWETRSARLSSDFLRK